MLRSTCALWGRWNSRDFLKGRGKQAGAVHTRHTHGSKGRYKRLSDMFGLRDGRRHAQNSMKGGLGIKLGGGLFGLRIPRQHLLSTMTREQFDLEMYGHPNITNPYRDLIDEHPDLKAVMESASVMPHLVVLLPRVRRDLSSGAPTAEVPAAWQQVGEQLNELFASFFLTTQVLLCTLDASVEVCFAPPTVAPTAAAATSAEEVHAALLALYREHCRTGRRLVQDKAATPQRLPHRKPSLALFGAGMQRTSVPNSTPGYTSAALARLAPVTPTLSVEKGNTTAAAEKGSKGVVVAKGVSDLVHEFRERFPDALCVCLRPSAVVARADPLADTTPSMMTTTQEERSRAALQRLKAVLEKGKARQGHEQGQASQTTSPPVDEMLALSRKARQLRKADVDPDTQKGVWATPPTAHLGELLRWQYANRDPRAHSSDGVPHKARRLPCVFLVDLSKQPPVEQQQRQRQHNEKAAEQRVQSLLPDEVSDALVTLRYVPVKSANLEDTLAELRQWHVECSWSKMLELQRHNHAHAAAAAE